MQSHAPRAIAWPTLWVTGILWVTAMLLLAACTGTGLPEPSAQATIDALSTANAQLAAQVTAQATPAAPPVNEPATPPAAGETPSLASTVRTVGTGPLPQLVADLPLAPPEKTIFDLRVDRTTNQLFVTDTANQLHVLDATTLAPMTVLSLGGWLELDAPNQRLYVYQPFASQDEPAQIHVLDTTSLAEVGALPGNALAVDSAHNRLFVGDRFTYATPPEAPGVRIVDGATLEQTGSFTQTGAPVYNPQRNELLILAYTAYTADPQTQQVTGDLFPALTDLGEGGFLWCNGCTWVEEGRLLPTANVIALSIPAHCAGKGCGEVAAPFFLDATTLAPLDPLVSPLLQATCGSQAQAVGAVDGRRYRNQLFDRYVAYTNFRVADSAGAPITWREGLRTEFINPSTNQGYLYDGSVIDLATLAPIGQWPAACLFDYEADAGLLYGRRGQNLVVIAERGGQPAPPPPPVAEALPAYPVMSIRVSPNFGVDQTLLVEMDGSRVYRSTDGGASWQRLQGGLPTDEYGTLRVAFSPNYGNDRTLYATGQRSDAWGEGVWRSTDGGDSWAALWNNLVHRRGQEFIFDADFPQSRTLVLRAAFNDLTNQVSGESYQQSTDGGLNWTLVVTGNYTTATGTVPLPPVGELLPGGLPPAPNARIGGYGQAIEYTLDGSTWQTATLPLRAGDRIIALLAPPDEPTAGTLYAFTEYAILRSQDGGASWATWQDPRLDGMDFNNSMRAFAITPQLPDGGRRLVVGTASGQIWLIDPAVATWAALAGAPAAPDARTPAAPAAPVSPLPLPTATPATPSPSAAQPSAVEPLAGEPPAGLFRPQGSFAPMWEGSPRIQQDLGWARTQDLTTTVAALEAFEHGRMVWLQSADAIYVVYADGSWQVFEDTFEEGQPERDPAFVPPGGKLQPERGFGKVWRANEAVRTRLGWALGREEPWTAQVQTFERGLMVRLGGTVLTLIGDSKGGRWY